MFNIAIYRCVARTVLRYYVRVSLCHFSVPVLVSTLFPSFIYFDPLKKNFNSNLYGFFIRLIIVYSHMLQYI